MMVPLHSSWVTEPVGEKKRLGMVVTPVIPALWEAEAGDQPDQYGETPFLLKIQN